jgi:Flp pilus assembly protein TadG
MAGKRRRDLWSAEEGLGAIEFGFVAPVLAVIMLGILDFGMAYWQQMAIANAADAGTQWAMTNTYNADNITSVVQAATNLSLPAGNVSSSTQCGCATSSGVNFVSCTTSCPDSSTPKTYVVVNARICYKPIFAWPGLNFCSGSDGVCSGCTQQQIPLSAQSVVLKN